MASDELSDRRIKSLLKNMTKMTKLSNFVEQNTDKWRERRKHPQSKTTLQIDIDTLDKSQEDKREELLRGLRSGWKHSRSKAKRTTNFYHVISTYGCQ